MAQRFPTLRLNLHQPDAMLRIANLPLFVACALLCTAMLALSCWAFALEQLTALSLAVMGVATLCVLTLNRHVVRTGANWLSVEHSGQLPVLLISGALANKIELTEEPRLEADWIAFHRLGRLAWLSLKITNHQHRRGMLQVLFLWQAVSTNSHDMGKAGHALKDWARRWHTLQNMTEKNRAHRPAADND
jgi:hypothetical protein